MKFFMLIGLCFSLSVHAYDRSVSDFNQTTPQAVTLVVAADMVMVPVSMTVSEKDPLRNMTIIRTFTANLKKAIEKSPSIKLRQGNVLFSMAAESESKFLSSHNDYSTSGTTLFLVSSLQEGRDFYLAVQEIATLVQAVVQTMDKTVRPRLSLGAASLGIEAPERLRPRLLELMRKDIEQTRLALGNFKSAEVSGLEQAVVIKPVDDKNVMAYLPYRFTLGQ